MQTGQQILDATFTVSLEHASLADPDKSCHLSASPKQCCVSPPHAYGIAHGISKVSCQPGSEFQSIGQTAQAEASAGLCRRSVWQCVGAAGQATPAEVQEVDPFLDPTLHRTHVVQIQSTITSKF